MEKVILVDETDREVGTMSKTEAHKKGLLHRAFSVFVFNDKNQLMLQKRSKIKYHSAGLWSNTCCGHPRPDEVIQNAAERRLNEEMGFRCPLKERLCFTYTVTLENGLIENEYDHLFIGHCNDTPIINPQEASEWKYMDWEQILVQVTKYPNDYTYWFKLCVEKLLEKEPV